MIIQQMKPVLRKLRNGLCQVVSKMVNFDPNENLVIFGDARGGSTWMAELIGQVPKTVLLWEPLHIGRVDYFKQLNFAWRQHIPEDETWYEAQGAFEQLFRGKVLTHYTCSFSSPFYFLFADRMLVKFCRANALVPWLTRVFDFKYEPIYLVRHPFAVVASQLSHPAWESKFDGYQIPDGPYNDLYLIHAHFLSNLNINMRDWLQPGA
jgi:hypothetical protein